MTGKVSTFHSISFIIVIEFITLDGGISVTIFNMPYFGLLSFYQTLTWLYVQFCGLKIQVLFLESVLLPFITNSFAKLLEIKRK